MLINIHDWINLEIPDKNKYTLHNNFLSNVSIPSDQLIINKYTFSNRIKNIAKVTDQKDSGRCWIFAGLNIIRQYYITKYNIDNDFELSQKYIFFWDKFERMNFYLNSFSDLCNKSRYINSNNINEVEMIYENRVLDYILEDPFDDGGQICMFSNIIEKYGIVPKDIYNDSIHSQDSTELNMILSKKLREYYKIIKSNIFNINNMLHETFILLVKFLGKPPYNFDWEFYSNKYSNNNNEDIEKIYNNISFSSPKCFYKEIDINFNNYMTIINDPRNLYNKLYSIKQNNIYNTIFPKYLNLEINRLSDLVKKSIDNNEAVWFTCDVDQYLSESHNIMDNNLVNYEEYLDIKLNLDKRDRLELKESKITHAMIITGYNIDKNNNINRYEIQNSWGDDKSKFKDDGYYTMTSKWFNEFVYQIFINKKYLFESEINIFNTNIYKYYDMWDPFGSAAKY